MADLAMELARAAAQRALAPPDPDENATHPAAALATASPRSRAPRPASGRLATLPANPDPNLVFISLCRCVRETIALERHLAAEHKAFTDAQAEREQGRALAAALNARFPQQAAKPAPAPAPREPLHQPPDPAAEQPLWTAVLCEARGPSG